jgi:hypothetical protein
MKKNLRILSLLVIPFFVFACPNYDGNRDIIIVNKSDKDVGYQLHIDRISSIEKVAEFLCNNSSDAILKQDSIFILHENRYDWETILDTTSYLQILIMDGEIFSIYYSEPQYYSVPCDTIRKYVPVLKCYRLTLKDLQQMNWTVTFTSEN